MKKSSDTLALIFVVIIALFGSYIVQSTNTLIHCLGLAMIMFPIGAYGYYDVNDFLKMKNEEILKMNNGKKFDIVLMNPPYGDRIKNEPLHFKFVEKCNKIVNKQITVMPFKLINATSDRDKIWKEKFSQHLISVQEEDSKQFKDTGMPNVGIYYWDNNYNENNINIKYIDGNSQNVKSLLDISNINEIEQNIFKLLDNNDELIKFNLKIRSPKGTPIEERNKEKIKLCERFSKKDIYKNKWFLSVGAVGWGKNGTFITSKNVGNIYNNFNDILNNWINNDLTTIKYIVLNSKLAAENCLNALQRPLLRLTVYRIQDDQNLNNKCYRYVPNINWEDDRVKTDEGLLEVCGCPKDKCKEYAEYCKKIIDEVDKK